MTKQRNYDDEINTVANDVSRLNKMMVAVVVVVVGLVLTLVFALGAMVTSSLAEKQATYQNLRDQVKDQNGKIQALTDKINDLTHAVEDGQKTLQKTN